MATEFKFPDVGEGIHEGEVKKWLMKEGDAVLEHQTIVEVETDKAVVAIPSPRAGTLLKIHVPEGKVVKVGETLATIGEGGEKVAAIALAPAQPPAVSTAAAPAPATRQAQKGVAVVGELEEAPPEEEEAAKPREVLATPAVRRLARELRVDLQKVSGTGPSSRITDEDVRKAAAGPAVPAPQPATAVEGAPVEGPKVVRKYDVWGYIERVPFKGVRKAVAKHMTQSVYTAPHVTSMDDADVTHLWDVRAREEKLAADKGVKLTFLPFIMKACVAALRQHPYLNATLDEQSGEILLKKYYNLGFAVATPDGLLVPVVKGVDAKGVLDLGKEVAELAEKARARTIDLQDMRGGTFSITNYGSIGTRYGTPIINYPEVAILGLGRIRDEAVVREGQVVVRKILPLALAFDHRVVDGAIAAEFMNTLKRYLEDPDSLLVA